MISKFQDQVDDNEVVCPYCKYSYQPESEDYSEDSLVDKCEECGMKFHTHQSFTVTNYASPDCELNGEQHQWVPVQLKDKVHDFCSVCDSCRPHRRESDETV